MFQERTLSFLLKNDPDHTNVDPWNEGSTIKCADLIDKYKECLTTTRERGATHMLSHCRQMKGFAVKCFVLEGKYFKQAVVDAQLEDSYFSVYMNKEIDAIRMRDPQKTVWKTKANQN